MLTEDMSINPSSFELQQITSVPSGRPFRYMPLNEATGEIRLLTLHPGKFDDPVRVTLTHVPFTAHNVPSFEALSYAWGSQENSPAIYVGRNERSNTTLSITQNLAVALLHLRYEDRPRILWIDAICVNQQNLKERSQQVQRMAEIFYRASRVVVWLGPSSSTTAMVLNCFDKIASRIELNWAKREITDLSGAKDWVDFEERLQFSVEHWLAILEYIDKDWFERLWCYQEIQLASDQAILLCGRQEYSWLSFVKAVHCLALKFYLPRLPSESLQLFRNRREVAYSIAAYSHRDHLSDLIQLTKNCKCSDPRDRIFALLSLANERTGTSRLIPDYSSSTHDVYQDAMIKILSNTKSWSIFRTVEMREDIERLPSWVPDWSIPKLSTDLSEFLACGRSPGRARFPEREVLRVDAVIVDTIEVIKKFDIAVDAHQDIAARLKDVVLYIEPVYSVDLILGAISRVLNLRYAELDFPPSSRHLPMAQIQDGVLEILTKQIEEWAASTYEVIKDIAAFGGYRSLFKTKQGHFGLAPEAAREGDLVTIILGCSNPMILRETPDYQFKIIGESYCDGIMEGQALLGPLPDDFKFVQMWKDETGVYYGGFLNTETGCAQVEDPRMNDIPLPPGWSIKKHRTLGWEPLFENEATHEVTSDDPRLTPEALRKRGIMVREIDII